MLTDVDGQGGGYAGDKMREAVGDADARCFQTERWKTGIRYRCVSAKERRGFVIAPRRLVSCLEPHSSGTDHRGNHFPRRGAR